MTTQERQPEIADEVVDRAEIKDGNVLVSYSRTEAALAQLKHELAGVQFEVATVKGDQLARSARLRLVRLQTGLEAKRKELKAPALEFGQKIDEEAKRIKLEIETLKEPIDLQIVNEEQRKERAREARIEAERQRVAAIRGRIDQFAAVARRVIGLPAAEVEAAIKLVAGVSIDETFAELKLEAEISRSEALVQLREMQIASQAQEAEVLRIAAERAELDRQRAVQAEAESIERQRIATERERIAAEQAAEAQRLDAARAAQERADAEAKAAREQADRDAANARAEADRKAQEARDAEQRRIDAERAELTRQQDELRRRAADAMPRAEDVASKAAPAPDVAPRADEPATLKLGTICERLGFTMTAAFVADTLSIKPAKVDGAARLYRESDFGRICAQLHQHIEIVRLIRREAVTA